MNPPSDFDLLIVGGGINGTGIAADAAGRGLKVLLTEMGDLGGATSSASSKMIHGGLRYLEHLEFRLVREALLEREVLLWRAPHIIAPQRFVLPHVTGMRPRLLIRLGLAIYDRLPTRQRIPPSSSLDLGVDPAGYALQKELTRGFAYWDCLVDDARLVVLNAISAAENGAVIETRTRARSITSSDGHWHIVLDNGKQRREIRARALVNAAGPWAAEIAGMAHSATKSPPQPLSLRLVKGSHIVVPRIPGATDAYLLQNTDGRVVFALPFETDFTLIGTTDVPVSGDPAAVTPSEDEEEYLISCAERFFANPPSRADIVWRFAGVRPLLDDGSSDPSALSRDYKLALELSPDRAPCLNVIGGKITTFRRLAEEALAKLAPHVPNMKTPWTSTAPLPGGNFGHQGVEGFRLGLAHQYQEISTHTLARLVRTYGTRASLILNGTRTDTGLGAPIGSMLTPREIHYLRDHEWARTPDDILWRRTKAGLHMKAHEREAASEQIASVLAEK
jgi:glycerol-3-phosphate dehydrogenase